MYLPEVKKRVVMSIGVLVAATVLAIPAVTTKPQTPHKDVVVITPDTVYAGVNVAMSNIIEDMPEADASLIKPERSIVSASPLTEVDENFRELIADFHTWCSSGSQLSVDMSHSIEADGITSLLSESHSQTDNITMQSHVQSKQLNYTCDMWYNVGANEYYVCVDTGDVQTGYVDARDSSPQIANFIQKQISYNTSATTVQTLLDYIVRSESYEIIPGVHSNWYSITYEEAYLEDLPVKPTFYTGDNLEKWGILFQYIDDYVHVDVIYYYKDSSVDTETFSYVFNPTTSCNLDYPNKIFTETSTLQDLEYACETLKGN